MANKCRDLFVDQNWTPFDHLCLGAFFTQGTRVTKSKNKYLPPYSYIRGEDHISFLVFSALESMLYNNPKAVWKMELKIQLSQVNGT